MKFLCYDNYSKVNYFLSQTSSQNFIFLQTLFSIFIYYLPMKLILLEFKLSNYYIQSFYLSQLINLYKDKKPKYTIKLVLQGLGFKWLYKSNKLILFLGYTHIIIIYLTSQIKLTIYGNILWLESVNLNYLKQVVSYLLSISKPNPYKFTGIWINESPRSRKFLR